MDGSVTTLSYVNMLVWEVVGRSVAWFHMIDHYLLEHIVQKVSTAIVQTFFYEYRTNEMRDQHKNKSTRENSFFIFTKLQNNITYFL